MWRTLREETEELPVDMASIFIAASLITAAVGTYASLAVIKKRRNERDSARAIEEEEEQTANVAVMTKPDAVHEEPPPVPKRSFSRDLPTDL